MRKLLLGSLVLTAFSIAILLFQISCQKSALAEVPYTLPPATTTTLGGVIVGSGLSVTSNGTLSVNAAGGVQQLNKIIFAKLLPAGGIIEIWTMNYDGSNQTKVNNAMPT